MATTKAFILKGQGRSDRLCFIELDTVSLTVRPALPEFSVEYARAARLHYITFTYSRVLMAQEQNIAAHICGITAELP